MSTSLDVEPEHILWHNQEEDILVVDGPRSIVEAQGPELNGFTITSTLARQVPYASQEPKSEAARARLLQSNGDDAGHSIHAAVIEAALTQVQIAYPGPWLLPRVVEGNLHDAECFSPTKWLEDSQSDGAMRYNETDDVVLLQSGNEHNVAYFVPALSTYKIADCSRSQAIASFHAELRAQASEAETAWRFDLMVIDPPWDNRSVKRKRDGYATRDNHSISNMLARMDLDRLMSVGCIVAVWITNKASARKAILGDGAYFDACGIDLLEEWLWVKTTDQGKPLSDIRGLWRKPYEILLIGRHRAIDTAPTQQEVKRRVLFGVPDLHSRKPCLKHLLETILLRRHDYRALEVFARHLVAGWWSLGNECLKFNDRLQWIKT